jgi:hypothetical protein
LTKLSIIIAFNFSTKQYFKKADDINKKILEDKESFVKAFNEKMNKINSTINKIFRKNGDHLKYKVEETNKYDNFSLLMVQLVYVNIFSGLNSLFVYVLSVILFLLGQFLKGMNLFNERMYKNIF